MLTYEREILECHSIQRLRVLEHVNEGGVFVEYNPATAGIMDISAAFNYNVKYGDYVMAYIKNNTKKGFKSRFISKIEEVQ